MLREEAFEVFEGGCKGFEGRLQALQGGAEGGFKGA